MAQLNAAQQLAVQHPQGPLLVLAGAGSGKTRVITQRIAHLLQTGVRPEAILAVSFTNKAAAELATRMRALIGADTTRQLWLSTFHRFGVRFLQEEATRIWGQPHFVIFDQGDSLGLVRELVRQQRAGERALDANAILSRISLWKNRFLTPEAVPESDFEYDAVARAVYGDYQAALGGMRAVDFDDLVVVPAQHLQAHSDVRDRWQARFRHLLIDEFQDTNHAQLRLAKLLCNPLRNICVVGDDDQAIYSWRGAEVRNILEFDQHFRGVHIVKLEDNYRSTAAILTVANAVNGKNKAANLQKTLRAARGPGHPVTLMTSADAAAEAKMVVSEMRVLSTEGYRLGDMAVLYRSNLQARAVEEELRLGGLSYRMLGGTQYYDRKEIKDAIAYLRLLVNPDDELALRRALHFPSRGLGPAALTQLKRFALMEGLSLCDALARSDEVGRLNRQAQSAATHFHGILQRSRRRSHEGMALTQVARLLFEEAGVFAELQQQGHKRSDSLEHFLRSLQRYESSDTSETTAASRAAPTTRLGQLSSFLQRLSLRFSDSAAAETKNEVTLSTLHAAKGLEFGVVFLIGCVEGQLPHTRSLDPKISDVTTPDIEEERRLFYVGVTRAKDRLYLCRPLQRRLRGTTTPLAPSRFLADLPEEALDMHTSRGAEELDHEELADFTSQLLAKLSQ